jgi:hypothetical protein
MKAQIMRNCPNLACCGELSWNTCDARTYHFAVEEHGSQYSIWEHTGHHSHVRCGSANPYLSFLVHTLSPSTLHNHHLFFDYLYLCDSFTGTGSSW